MRNWATLWLQPFFICAKFRSFPLLLLPLLRPPHTSATCVLLAAERRTQLSANQMAPRTTQICTTNLYYFSAFVNVLFARIAIGHAHWEYNSKIRAACFQRTIYFQNSLTDIWSLIIRRRSQSSYQKQGKNFYIASKISQTANSANWNTQLGKNLNQV